MRGPGAEGFRAGLHYASIEQECHKPETTQCEEIKQIETEYHDLSV